MKKIVNSSQAPKAIGPYSQAVEINGMLFISGQIPIDPSTGKIIEGGITEQTGQVMKNIGAILHEAGYDFKDVVKSTCLLSDIGQFCRDERRVRNFLSGKSTREGCLRSCQTAIGRIDRDRDHCRKIIPAIAR